MERIYPLGLPTCFLSQPLKEKQSHQQTVIQVACCFRIECWIIFTLALHSVRYSPPPSPQKKKNIYIYIYIIYNVSVNMIFT